MAAKLRRVFRLKPKKESEWFLTGCPLSACPECFVFRRSPVNMSTVNVVFVSPVDTKLSKVELLRGIVVDRLRLWGWRSVQFSAVTLLSQEGKFDLQQKSERHKHTREHATATEEATGGSAAAPSVCDLLQTCNSFKMEGYLATKLYSLDQSDVIQFSTRKADLYS